MGSVSEALVVVRGESPELVITDFSMPGENGADLIKAARKENAGIKFIVMSGDQGAVKAGGLEQVAVLGKPFTPEELASAIVEAMG